MRKKIQKWLLGIILNGQNSEMDCFMCQYKISELERRASVLEAKVMRMKGKFKHFEKRGGIK